MAKKSKKAGGAGEARLEIVAGAITLVFAVVISLFALRNNDIWWHLATGRELLAQKSFITKDPFSFTRFGQPWVPHSWLADLFLYGFYKLFSPTGLVVLRALLVAVIMILSLRLLRVLRVSWMLAMPVILLVILNAHSRFILRPHLFEYIFIVVMLGYLVTRRNHNGWRYLIPPVVLQIVWVNTHASFYLGIVLIALFYMGEWLSEKFAPSLGTQTFHGTGKTSWSKAAVLVGVVVLASFVNPDPLAFVLQPLQSEQRDLVASHTLEWRSPFDPAVAYGAFHPYYELLLAFTALAFVASIKRLKLASLLIVAAFLYLSLQAHRFRVEFALVALPLALDQLRSSPIFEIARKKLGHGSPRLVANLLAFALGIVLIVTARDRVTIDGAVSDRFPKGAFEFIREHGIAKRPFHGIGHGSYLVWSLYPERRSFIDGRNFDPELYRDFQTTQASEIGFKNAISGFKLDSFVLPIPESADAGMTNLHNFLVASDDWTLAYLDRNAYVYVKKSAVAPEWMSNTFRFYHPLTFHRLRFTNDDTALVRSEIVRATSQDERYLRPLLDLARFDGVMGNMPEAKRTVERALAIDPGNPGALEVRKFLSTLR